MFNQKFTPSKSREKKESARHALWLLFLLFMCGGQCVQSAAAYEPSVEYHLSRIEPKKKLKLWASINRNYIDTSVLDIDWLKWLK